MPFLDTIFAFLEATKYPLIFIGSYIEGSVVMVATGLLWKTGVVAFWPAYAALVLGDILADLMWYGIGYFGARRFMDRWGHYINMTPAVVAKIEHRFHTYHTSILIVSKLTMGFGFAVATLTTAGMMRVPLWRYIIINLLAGFVWIFALMLIGYYFGNIFDLIPRELRIVAGALLLITVFFVLRYVSRRIAAAEW